MYSDGTTGSRLRCHCGVERDRFGFEAMMDERFLKWVESTDVDRAGEEEGVGDEMEIRVGAE